MWASAARAPRRVFFVLPSRHLLCSLCDENFNEVVLPCAGGHTFCRACVLRWFERQRTCPECRAAIPANAALVPSRLVKAMVYELRVRCRFGVKEEGDGWVADEAGCPAQLTLDGAVAHEAACGFAAITCSFAGCGVELRRADIASHNAASMQAHLDGERAARLADATRLSALEARVAMIEQRSPILVNATIASRRMRSNGWSVRRTKRVGEKIIWCCAFSSDNSSICTYAHVCCPRWHAQGVRRRNR